MLGYNGPGIERLATSAGDVAQSVEGRVIVEWSRALGGGLLEYWEAEIYGWANDWLDLDIGGVRVIAHGVVDSQGRDLECVSECRSKELLERCWLEIEQDDELQRRIAAEVWARR